MLRRDSLEVSDNHERWLVSYADFVTLLFAFFVVMYAISSVNEGKYRVLSSTLTAAFEAQPKSLDPIQIGEAMLAASPHIIDVPDETGYRDEMEGNAELPFSVAEASEAFDGMDDGLVSVAGDSHWLELTLDANVLFSGGNASLTPAASDVLSETANYLSEFDNPLTIEGYTDNVPSSGRYRSNWELSTARASVVAEFLVSAGIDRRRIAAVGYGENHSLATNATPEGRAANRRVAIVVARRLDLASDQGRMTFAAIRSAAPVAAPARQRTETGGLLFSNEVGDSETVDLP